MEVCESVGECRRGEVVEQWESGEAVVIEGGGVGDWRGAKGMEGRVDDRGEDCDVGVGSMEVR